MSRYNLYLENKDAWEKLYNKSHYANRVPKVEEVDNGIILPGRLIPGSNSAYEGGVCTSDFIFKAGLVRTPHDKAGWMDVRSCYKLPEEVIENSEEIVIYGGVLFCQYGHVMLELLSRMWYVLEHPECKYRIVFNVMWERKEWYWDFFELLGIGRDRVVFCDKATKYRKVIVPEQTLYRGVEYTDKYKLIINKMISNAEVGEDKKVYLTASANIPGTRGGAICCNEQYFEQYFAKKGYRVVAPEKLTLREKVSILQGAEEVVTTLGTTSIFALFCKPNTNFTILLREGTETLLHQAIVNEVSGVNCTIVDVSHNFLPAHFNYGVCFLTPNDYWQEYIKDKFQEELSAEEKDYSSLYEDYVKAWCEYFAIPKRFKPFEEKEDHFTIISRMNRVLLGKELKVSDYQPLKITNQEYRQLKEKEQNLEKTIKEQQTNYDELEKNNNLLQQEIEIKDSIIGKLKELLGDATEEKLILQRKLEQISGKQ